MSFLQYGEHVRNWHMSPASDTSEIKKSNQPKKTCYFHTLCIYTLWTILLPHCNEPKSPLHPSNEPTSFSGKWRLKWVFESERHHWKYTYLGVSKNNGTPKWMDIPIKMDDLGGKLTIFGDTPYQFHLEPMGGTQSSPSFFCRLKPSCMVEGPCDVGQGTQRCDASPFL